MWVMYPLALDYNVICAMQILPPLCCMALSCYANPLNNKGLQLLLKNNLPLLCVTVVLILFFLFLS